MNKGPREYGSQPEAYLGGRTFQAEGIVGAKMGVYLLYSRNGKGPSIARVE